MKRKYHGFVNHLIRNYDITPKQAWWALCPGSHTIDFFKIDKTNVNAALIAGGYFMESITDVLKTSIYGIAATGIFYAGAKLTGNEELVQGIERFLK